MVDCDGLENRCAGNRTGGSNPSPSAIRRNEMREYLPIIIIGAIAVAVFVLLLRQGAFLRISNYFRETQEELKKCTWPTWEELMGSTAVVLVSVAFLGCFTVAVDFLVANLIRLIV